MNLTLKLSYQDILEQVKIFVRNNLVNAPSEIKLKIPRVLSSTELTVFIFKTNDYFILAFLNPKEKERVISAETKKEHPFFALIKPPKIDAPVFFNLDDGTRNTYVGKMTLKDGFAFSIGKDCTLIIEELRQSVLIKGDKRYEYEIDLAYLVSFGNEINEENILDYLKDIIAYSFEVWRKGDVASAR